MRRVDRGPWPLDDANTPKSFQPYNKAKADLLSRLGGYCRYCERTGDLHIEHVVPTNHRPDLEQEWTNFLFGCANCNAIKGLMFRSLSCLRSASRHPERAVWGPRVRLDVPPKGTVKPGVQAPPDNTSPLDSRFRGNDDR